MSKKELRSHRNAPSSLITTLISLIFLSWLWMQIVHEVGHCAGALLTGGVIKQVYLHPLSISQTFVDPNPNPLFVIWSGPVLGCLLPLLLWLMVRRYLPGMAHLFRFFAGFCLIANGAYLGSGVFDPVGDSRDLVMHSVPGWQMGLFGVIGMSTGLCLWHQLGEYFGLETGARPVPFSQTIWLVALLGLTVSVEMLLHAV